MESLILQLLAQGHSESFMIKLVKWINPILEPVVIVVLVLLIAMSAACWGIIYFKWRNLHRAQEQSAWNKDRRTGLVKPDACPGQGLVG